MRVFAVLFAVLACAAPAAAAGPRFALFDLQTDLAKASRNTYGDVQVKPRAAVAGHGTLAQCGAWCRFGEGWLAFGVPPRLQTSDVTAAAVRHTRRDGWMVELTLRPAAMSRWASFAKLVAAGTKRRGVPDVLVVIANGQIAAAPYSTQAKGANGRVTLAGFSRASANALVKSLG